MATATADAGEQLAHFLNISDATEIVSYIESFNSKQDLEEYLYGLLDENVDEHREFVENYLENWKPGVKSVKKPSIAANNTKTVSAKVPLKTSPPRQTEHRAKPVPVTDYKSKMELEEAEDGSTTPQRKSKKGKSKYSPLFVTKRGFATAVVQLPGRHKCDCEATKHDLINNCLHCGKIVCEQEGAGPCTFCGKMVYTKDDQSIYERDLVSSQQVLHKLKQLPVDTKTQSKDMNAGLRKALEHKDKLLEFDQTVEKRTKIIDDQCDYYTLDNLWLTKEEREVVKKRDKAVESKRNTKEAPVVTFDFAGRQVVEERLTAQEELQRQFEQHLEKLALQKNNSLVNAQYNGTHMPRALYDPSVAFGVSTKGERRLKENISSLRLQGGELQEMNDQGWCLSLHQPYASLLVAGLKMHEGRSWYTPIRGTLWIASTAQNADRGFINKMEETIRVTKHSEQVIFPENYPVGALLGCVNLVDCLPQEEYREKFSVTESDSPFVFICENPRELVVKFPIRGKHKIYKLDARIHEAAKKTLKCVEEMNGN